MAGDPYEKAAADGPAAGEGALGKHHYITLSVSARLAHWTAVTGDLAAARDEYAALLPVCERVYGAEHLETLANRRELACLAGEAGDVATALAQCQELLRFASACLAPTI